MSSTPFRFFLLRPRIGARPAAHACLLVLLTCLPALTARAQYHLGTRYLTGSASASEGSVGSEGSEEGGQASGSGEVDTSSATYGPGNTDLGGGTVTLARAIFNGGIVSNGTVSASDTHEAHSGEVTAVLTGTARLEKQDSDTFTLNSASTYSGSTRISDGTLKLGAAGSIAQTSAIRLLGGNFDVSDVPGGFTLGTGQTLGGTGTVNGLLIVGPGARLAPGNSPGTTTFADGLTLGAGSVLNFELGMPDSDLLLIAGGDLTGPGGTNGITLNLSNVDGFTAGTYDLITLSSIGGSFVDFDLGDFTLGGAINGYDYFINFSGNTLQLIAIAIPEPATYALGVSATGLVAIIVRRRRLVAKSRSP